MLALDTNVCIEILRSRNVGVVGRYRAANASELFLPSIVAAELLVGAAKSQRPTALVEVDAFLSGHAILKFGEPEARVYAKIRAELEMKGSKIGSNDLLIAATALGNQLTLVTHNTSEFSRVDGLSVVDWHAD